MDYLWVFVTFVSGFLFKQINLPPLVGFLAAGFGLHAFGMTPNIPLEPLADIGIILLLFTIGLKLDIKSLFKYEIWSSATANALVTVVFVSSLAFLLTSFGIVYFSELSWMSAAVIGFALSFSSTVFAVKMLEDRGEMRARHGQVAIGILVIQDIMAVIFLSLATDKTASWWALSVLALPLLKPLLTHILTRSGHGEVLVLTGFFLAFSGSQLFDMVGLEKHLGALAVGMILSGEKKAVELSKSLMSFKDIFLIGFFLSIGFTALPTLNMLGIALLISLLLPLKGLFYFLWLTRSRVKSRTSFLTAVNLSNFSEFGLIVCAISVSYGLLPKEWLVILALSVAFSFVLTSSININVHNVYMKWSTFLKKFESEKRLAEDRFARPKNASILVIGMGRVGTGVFDTMRDELKKEVCGVDVVKRKVIEHKKAKRNVIMADAEDPDFWSHIDLEPIHLILFSIPNHHDILEANKQIRLAGYQGKTAAIAKYEDQERELLKAGIDVVFNYYAKVGTGFAEQTLHLFDEQHLEI